MQTNFTLAQLADPNIAVADKILRACVHCGFCTATCPTYVLLGDELDSPRGRIYLIKEMLEKNKPPTREVVKHIDRCLSCLACMTTCPSGVNYMHLVDQARVRIEQQYARPLAPQTDAQRIFPVEGTRKGRVALLSGCVDRVVQPAIRAAAIRLLNRQGIEVVLTEGEACCGSLSHHMGREHEALAFVRNNVDAWTREIEGGGLDAILITASGCGTTIKDYGFMLRTDPSYRDKAAKVSELAKDISEYLAKLAPLPPVAVRNIKVAYHSACSMQHGQQIDREPKELLAKAGFIVRDIPEGHLCCGSAGTYNMLQSDIAARLLARKVENIAKTSPQVVATGNIGCITQIASGISVPVVHTVELLDWATGGPLPEALKHDPEKWEPVFGKDHASAKMLGTHVDST